MLRRVIGAAVTAVGVLAVVFAPLHLDVVGCDCPGPFGSHSFQEWIYWPPGWYWLHRPMQIIGVALVVTGMVFMRRARRFG